MSVSDLPPALPHLLIVDDDAALGKTLLAILQRSGYKGHWASTGHEAIGVLKNHLGQTNIVLIDLHLPDLSGLDVLQTMKQIDPDIGAIMITGHAEIETAVGALKEGAFAYIQKPYHVDEVKATLAKLIERQTLAIENRQLLQKMISLNSELEERVRQRTADLQAANLRLANTIAELQKADAVKSEFISMISHELRTPLTVIIGCSRVLLNQLEGLNKETIRRYIDLVDKDAHRLSRLVEEILDLAEIQKKGIKLKYVRFDLSQQVMTIINGLQAAHKTANIQILFQEDIKEIYCDPDRIQQIFLNLLSNALKYSPEGEEIRVVGERCKEGILISIEDRGRGIPPAEKEKIFEPFYRTTEAINYKHPGTGLGLTITKAIVETIGGKIWIENGVTRGTTIRFTLPPQVVCVAD